MTGTILIVDDEPDIRGWLAACLAGEGCEIVTTASGVEALEQLGRATFDVMILDVRMPGMDGLEVLHQAGTIFPDLETIICTGYANLETAIECLRAGAADLVQKPSTAVEVSTAVSRALERRQLRASTALYQACQAIFASPADPQLARRIVEVAASVMSADEVSLMLLDRDGCLDIAYASGPAAAAAVEGPRTPLGGRIAGRVLLDRTPVVLNGAPESDPRFGGIRGDARIRSSIVYPLVAGVRAVGVLTLNRVSKPQPFRARDLELAAVLASQILLALENSRLASQMVGAERLASIGLVAAGVAHEINNPAAYALASQAYVDVQLDRLQELGALLDQGADAETLRGCWEGLGGRGFLEELRHASRDASEGMGRIRDIARDLRSLVPTERSSAADTADLNDVLRCAIRVASAEIRGHATVVEQFGTDVAVCGTSGQLSQVFINLLANAGQAVAGGPRARGEIVVTTRREGERIVARVADNGPGIRPEHLRRLFEPFFSTKEAERGTGLGLSISRDLVRRLGGDIQVSSTLGAGATFTVDLPAARATDPRTAASGPPAPASGAPTQDARRGRLRLLIVDDEPALLRSLERWFAKEHDVVLAAGGDQALRALRQHGDFDLVLCDLLMPGINGVEFYRRALEGHAHLGEAFVFMTGSAGIREFEAFLVATGQRVLYKPLDLRALHEVIARRAEQRAAAR